MRYGKEYVALSKKINCCNCCEICYNKKSQTKWYIEQKKIVHTYGFFLKANKYSKIEYNAEHLSQVE